MLGISLAKRVNCHMTTQVLNVVLTDGITPYYTTHAIVVHSASSSIQDKTTNNFRVQTEILHVRTEAIGMNVRC